MREFSTIPSPATKASHTGAATAVEASLLLQSSTFQARLGLVHNKQARSEAAGIDPQVGVVVVAEQKEI